MISKLEDFLKSFKKDSEENIYKMKKVNLIDKIKFKKLNSKLENSPKLNMTKVKEVALITTAVLLIGVGYTNFSSDSTPSETIEKIAKSTNNIGDVQLVSSNAVIVDNEEDEKESGAKETAMLVENEENQNIENTLESSSNSGENQTQEVTSQETSTTVNFTTETSSYFAELRLERNDMYSKSLETYQKIVDSSSISNEQKAIAIQEIENINEKKNAISVAEELIKLKGFDDVVIYETNDIVSVIVRISVLTDAQVAQIQNIVSRELSVQVSNINISNK